ncbi:AbrB/MazE/SpoVT family DNA-binding domain-containing protein [Halovivax limisalsi]|uniref:AbrB/MazE/SpoVT family DNA-binding domain-containing protein n=1 Tax=Halovivax limisalsi TaxID=1453760 RepID=UPI001FFCDB97|nr:AbrB/MazE/SpoVT family DNA-binding domain-containing protein [Halovivax limisalsi]
MADIEKRTVGSRGQVTIPKELRDEFGIRGGDDVTVRRDENKIVIEPTPSREKLAEGYQRRAAQHRELAEELSGIGREATDELGDAPEWEDA